MNDKSMKEAYLSVEVPDMKEEILTAVSRGEYAKPRRKLRPAAAVGMAMLCLCMLMSAAAAGTLLLREGSRYYFRDSDGNTVKPNGFHTEEEPDVQLSEKALANIAPYIFTAGDPATVYETETCGEMEEFLDFSMRLPVLAQDASFYRMWACGADGEAASIYVQIPLEGGGTQGFMSVYLRNGPLNILTSSTPKMYDYALPDGTTVSIASYETKSGNRGVSAIYEDAGAFYHISLRGNKTKELLTQIKAMLDTVP